MSTASSLFTQGARAKGMVMGAGGPTSLTPDSPFRRQEAYNYINPGFGQGGKQFFKYGVSRKVGRQLIEKGLKASRSAPGFVQGASEASLVTSQVERVRGSRAAKAYLQRPKRNFVTPDEYAVLGRDEAVISHQGRTGLPEGVYSGSAPSGPSPFANMNIRPAQPVAPVNPIQPRSSMSALAGNIRQTGSAIGGAVSGVYNRARQFLGRQVNSAGGAISGGYNRARQFLGEKVNSAGRGISSALDRVQQYNRNRISSQGEPLITKIGNSASNFFQGFSTGLGTSGRLMTPPPIANKSFGAGYKTGSALGRMKNNFVAPRHRGLNANRNPGFTSPPQTPPGPGWSLGTSKFFDTVGANWSGLSNPQQWALGGAGAVAGLVALNVGYNSIKNSKQSPFGSAVAGGLLVGGGAMGLRYGGRALSKWGTEGAKGVAQMRAIGAGMAEMGPSSWKGAAKLGGYTAGGVAALGVGRSVIGQ